MKVFVKSEGVGVELKMILLTNIFILILSYFILFQQTFHLKNEFIEELKVAGSGQTAYEGNNMIEVATLYFRLFSTTFLCNL